MKVILAEHAGFCFGVKRAIDKAFHEVAENQNHEPMYSLGPLIHNQQVVERLTQLGVKEVQGLEEVQEPGKIIIRSHGVSEALLTASKKQATAVIDTTCPFVQRIQTIVKRHQLQQDQIVIIGDAAHPEVIAINGWCDNQAVIVQQPEDLELLSTDQPLCVVVQTTMSIPLYQELIGMIKERFSSLHHYNTICLATQERQRAAQKLAKEVDAMVVIGGYHSSNTQKLVSLCRLERPNSTFHIETAAELDWSQLKQYETIGVTAGASTPDWIIEEVVHDLEAQH